MPLIANGLLAWYNYILAVPAQSQVFLNFIFFFTAQSTKSKATQASLLRFKFQRGATSTFKGENVFLREKLPETRH